MEVAMKEAKLHKHECITPDQGDKEQSKENSIHIARVILFLIFIICMLLFLSSVLERLEYAQKLFFNLSGSVIVSSLPLFVSIVGSWVMRLFVSLLYREKDKHLELVTMDTGSYLAELKRRTKPNSLAAITQWSLAGLTKLLTRSTTTGHHRKPKRIRLLRL
jgi:hypothetical protein